MVKIQHLIYVELTNQDVEVHKQKLLVLLYDAQNINFYVRIKMRPLLWIIQRWLFKIILNLKKQVALKIH